MAKRKREDTPPPSPNPSRPASNGLLTPPTPQKKQRVHSPVNTSAHLQLSALGTPPFSQCEPERPTEEEDVSDTAGNDIERTDDTRTGTGDASIKSEDVPVTMGDIPALPPGPPTGAEDMPSKIETETDSATPVKAEGTTPDSNEPQIKQEDEQTPADDGPPTPKSEPDDEYRFSKGPHAGSTLDEVPEHYLKEICEDGTIDEDPELKAAVTEWASEYTLPFGMFEGYRLEDVPMHYFNQFILKNGADEPSDDGLFVALKYHLPVRKPEIPGSKYVLHFGKHKGMTIRQADEDPYGSKYSTYMENEGMAEKAGYENVAEGMEYYYNEEGDESNRWMWRMQEGFRNGKRHYEHPRLGALLYPSTEIPVPDWHDDDPSPCRRATGKCRGAWECRDGQIIRICEH